MFATPVKLTTTPDRQGNFGGTNKEADGYSCGWVLTVHCLVMSSLLVS